jgi:eukaryotic-like serine/threonine-protein kinase
MTTNFGKYKLVAELGQGGMADVILALAQGPVGFSKLVVIKRLREHLAEDPEFVTMLLDEARLAARLNHPNIVQTSEVGEIDGRFYLCMEYLEGQPLARIYRRAQRQNEDVPLAVSIRVICDVLAGLHYAHELADYDGTSLGIVHRDVTPSNVFVTYEGQVKVVDFGIAKAARRSTETRTGVVKGKMKYMPPEQAMGVSVDRRADVFAVGVMLWEAATKARMWEGVDEVVILSKLIAGQVPTSARERNPEVPEELDAICRKALAIDPGARYASAVAMQTDLEAFEASLGTVSPREVGQRVGALFAKERDQFARIVEEQLAKIAAQPSGDSLELQDGVAISQAGPSLRMPYSDPGSGSGTRGRTLTDASPGETGAPDDELASASVRVARKRGAPRRSMLGVGTIVVATAAMLTWLVVRRPGGDASGHDTKPQSVTSASSAAAEPTAIPGARVRLTLRAVPPTARFSIDGGAWLENPHAGDVALDMGIHRIRIEAPGHQPRTVSVSFAKDVVLDVTLDEDGSESPAEEPKDDPDAVAASPPRPRVVPTGDPATAPKRPVRELLDEDPWGDQ